MRRTFAIAARDELWIRGRLAESRLGHGTSAESGYEIEACDDRDDELVRAVDERLELVRRAVSPAVERTRIVVSARRSGGAIVVGATLTMAHGELSLVSAPEHAERDRQLLAALAARERGAEQVDYRALPLVWRGGAAAVLLHEAAGHPAELGHAPLRWPAWLSVRDEPDGAPDDCGLVPSAVDLLASERPAAWRRESFRDVALRRMSRLIATQSGAELDEPAARIDVHLVAHGAYDPLTEELTLKVAAADLVEGSKVRPLPPFWIAEHRANVAAAITGASGPPLRYPGVVCSLEGQEVVVESFAPVMTTRFR